MRLSGTPQGCRYEEVATMATEDKAGDEVKDAFKR